MQPAKTNWLGKLQKRHYAYVEREDKALFERLKRDPSLQPRLTAAKIAAFALAMLIHSVMILLPLLAVVVIIQDIAGYCSVLCGIALVALAVAARPRFNKLPEQIVSHEKFPALYQYVDQIADQLQAPHMDFIAINEFFTASYGKYGVSQSRLLTLGYPLWTKLDPAERIALVAHEMAHVVNGDFARNFVVGAAMNSLAKWYVMFDPGYRSSRDGLAGVMLQFLSWIATNVVFALLFLMRHLLLLESRRAEYLADHLAASIGGTDAMISTLKKLQERINKTIPISTHPPIAYRIAMLEAKPVRSAAVVFSEEEMAKMDAEIGTLDSEITERIRLLRQQGRNYY